MRTRPATRAAARPSRRSTTHSSTHSSTRSTTRSTIRSTTARATALLAACAAALLAACGGQDGASVDPGGGVTTESPSSAPATTPARGPTDLTVVAGDGSGTSTTWRLTCDPPGGDHPDAEAACAALAAHGATALPPVPKDQVCTMVYGGPQTATVTGTWRGERVSASFNRTNGCEISRWESLAALLPSTAS